MTRAKISQLDAAAANNTDINAVNVAEGCPPSGINNAIREMGAMLKRMDNGTDHLTDPNITGSLDVDNININGNTISSTDTNGNINITPNGSGAVAFTTNATFGDNDKAIFGAGSDLQITHTGSHSQIVDSGTGGLFIGGSSQIGLMNAALNEYMVNAAENGAVTLYHDNSAKLATTSTGVDVTGTATATTFQANAGGTFTTASGNDLNIVYPDSRSLFIKEGSTTHLTVDNVGNVGIGTASVDNKLHLENAGSLYLQIENTSTANKFYVGNSGGNAILESTGAYSMNFKTNGTERMRLDSGNLLIGTTSSSIYSTTTTGINLNPNGATSFNRASGQAAMFNRTSSDGDIVQFRKDGITVGSIGTIGGDMVAGTGDTGLRFHDGADQVYPSNTNGSGRDAAIDLGNSGARFKDGYFNGSVYTTYVKGNGGHTGQVHFTGSHDVRFVTNGSERARFDDSANFLVGATSLNDTNGFTVFPTGSGSATMVRIDRNSNGTALQFRQGQSPIGTVSTTTSGVTYNTSSDRRLKSNIQDAESASDKIDAIQVRQFDWNVDNSHQDYGLIAQELQPIEPMAVTGDADSDEMMGVDYSKLVPMLIKEIQELRSRVATLEAN